MRTLNGDEDAERLDDTCCGWDVACTTLKHSLTVSMKTKHTTVIHYLDGQAVPCSRLALPFTQGLGMNVSSSFTQGV